MLKIELPHDSAKTFLDIFLKDLKSTYICLCLYADILAFPCLLLHYSKEPRDSTSLAVSLSADEDKHSILLRYKEEWNYNIGSKVDRTKDHLCRNHSGMVGTSFLPSTATFL